MLFYNLLDFIVVVDITHCPELVAEAGGGMRAVVRVLFLELFLLLLLRFLYFNNVVDCHGLLKEAGMLGLNGGNCRRFILRVVVGVITPFFILIMLFYVF